MSEELIVTQHGQILALSLNRPTRRNALTASLVTRLALEFEKASERNDLRAIVLSGEGNAFCSGADLGDIQSVPASERETRLLEFHRLIRAVAHSTIPTVAKVHGAAAGFGADLALACDFRVFSTVSFLQESFVNVGLMPDGGATYFLPAMVGYSQAIEMLLLGERFDATELMRLGLAHRVVPVEALDAATDELCERLTRVAPLAVLSIKKALHGASLDLLSRALEREKEGQLALLGSEDFAEGVQAFSEKRAPRFTRR